MEFKQGQEIKTAYSVKYLLTGGIKKVEDLSVVLSSRGVYRYIHDGDVAQPNDIVYLKLCSSYGSSLLHLGKDVFLTLEEAEAAAMKIYGRKIISMRKELDALGKKYIAMVRK